MPGCASHPPGDPAGGHCLFCIQLLTFEHDSSPLDLYRSTNKLLPVPGEMETPSQDRREGFQLFVHLHHL